MKKTLLVLTTALLAASLSFSASANSRGHEQNSHQNNGQKVTIVKNVVKHNNKQQNKKEIKKQKVVIVKQSNHVKKSHQKVIKQQPSTGFSISFGNGVNTSINIAKNVLR
ncbi:hypothetical protein [Psychromonas arctica]|uniref:hypothetical protein n=1 Tax=Psychromonas arctica TaxID=168275 RepID=UPI002FD44FCA